MLTSIIRSTPASLLPFKAVAKTDSQQIVEKDAYDLWMGKWAPVIPGIMMGVFQDPRVFPRVLPGSI